MTTVKPETVSIYQVKKTEKDTYKKRTNWRLKDLKLIDGKDETNVREAKESDLGQICVLPQSSLNQESLICHVPK